MNKLITHKITLALFFVIICQFTLKAQDTAKKMILVVRPGQTAATPAGTSPQTKTAPAYPANGTTIVPVRTAIYTPAADPNLIKPVTTPVKTAANNSTGSPGAPVKLGAPGIGASIPVKAPKYIAPTTSERTGIPVYMRHDPPVKKATDPLPNTAANAANKTNTPVAGATANRTNTLIAGGAPNTGGKVSVPVTGGIAGTAGNTVKTNASGTTGGVVTSGKLTTGAAAALTVKPVKKDTVYITKIKHDTVTIAPPKHTSNKILFGELGGPGLALSINYDMRFKDGKDGFGFRIGTGYFASGNNTVFTVPFQLNYLKGSDGKYLEVGIGTTYLNSTGDNYSSKNFIFDRIRGIIPTGTVGFRYEPEKSLNFRLGYLAIIDDDGFVSAGGFSVGYTF